MRVIDAGKAGVLCLGYAGEKDRTTVLFPFGDLAAEFPGGTVVLRIRRPWETDHHDLLPTISEDGTTAEWLVDDYDLENRGEGEVQLIYSDGTAICKKKVWETRVNRSIDGDNASVPPDWEDIENALVAAAGNVSREISEAEATLAQAVADAQAAQTAAETAQGAAETAQQDAETAKAGAEAAVAAAEAAQDRAEAAEGNAAADAADAAQSAQDASNSASAAALSASGAATSAAGAEADRITAQGAKIAAEAAQAGAEAAQAAAEAAVAGIETAGAAQVAAVNAAGTTQTGNVNTAGTTQVAAVNAAGAAVIESIPSDYSELSADVGDLKSALYNDEISVSTDTVGYINNDGVINPNTSWHCLYTDKISCEPGWKFRYRGGTYNGLANSVLFFNGKTAVSQLRYDIGSDVIVTVPDNVDGVIFQTATATGNPVSLIVDRTEPASITALSEQIDIVSEGIDSLQSIILSNITISADTVGYINNDGVINPNTSWHCLYTDKISCEPGWKFRYRGGTYNGIANSVLFFNGSTAVSQQQYSIGSDVEITVPSGVDGVIFQTASITSASISLIVDRLLPVPLEAVPDGISKINARIDEISQDAFKSDYESIKIFEDETKYSKNENTNYGTISPRSIPAYTYIESVRFKSQGVYSGYILIADSSIYSTYLRLRIVAMYPVTTAEGWNTVNIGFNTGSNSNYLIGFYNIKTVYGDYASLPRTTPTEYRFSVEGKNQYALISEPSVGKWMAATASGAEYFLCYAFTVVAYTGIIPEAEAKSDLTFDYVETEKALSDGTLLPKYKVIAGKQYGFIGRWYEYTYNGNDVMVGAAAGAEVCFKVSGTESITINWTGDYVSDDVYYCYMIDGGEKTRKNITQNTITLPDTDEHIVRIVCDSIPHNGSTTTCWINGYGFVFGGVESVGGTLKGIEPVNKSIMFFGDSLTEGVRALGVETSGQVEADVDSATESYGWYACKYLWATPILAGFGSTGIIANGYFKNCITAINYLSNGIETPDVSPDLIVINHGHNDTGISSADWQTAFNAMLDRIMTKYPGVQVVGLSPFNRTHADDMKTCCDARSWCHYIDSAPWALDRYYVDGPGHLTAEGAEVCGRYLAEAIKDLQLIRNS